MPKISQFPAGGVAQNTDLIPIVRNGGDYTVTGYNLASLASYGQAYVGTFTATAGQTVFTLPASPGSLANLFISVDGAVMVPGSDYTWTTPVTLTFAVGLKVGQTVLYNYTTSVPIGTSLAGGVSGQVQYNNSGVLNGTTIGGDATRVATTGALTVTKTAGVAFAASATTDTTNAANISSGILPVARQSYTQGGTGSVARTVTNKLQESVSVKDFGAVGDGSTNDAAAIVAAITYVSASGGRVYFPPGTYVVASSFTVPNYVHLVGAGMNASILKRTFTGDFITSFGGYSSLEDLTIEGNTASVGTGRGVVFAVSSPNSHFLNVEIKNFVLACVDFPADCGATFRAINCTFYTTGALGVVGAVKVSGVDTAATSRHFIGCESGGCTLYDINGCNDMYITGGYSNGIITSANTSKLLVNNMRIGSGAGTVTIYGASCRYSNMIFGASVILQCTNSYFHCEVPSYDITDNGTGNDVFIKQRSFTSTWTASGTAPAIGNGTIVATYARSGALIDVLWDITLGSTSTVGTGVWFFSLPRADYASLVQMCGSGTCSNGATNAFANYVVRVEPGSQKVSMTYIDTGGVARNVGAILPAAVWGAGSSLRLSCRYYTV